LPFGLFLGLILTYPSCSVDPEVKQKIDATIASTKQELAMCESEKKELGEQADAISEEDGKFKKRHVCYVLENFNWHSS
jgi:hypothetical protein